MNQFVELFNRVDLFRSFSVIVLGTFVVGNFAWWLRKRGMRDGFTRKINHFGLSILSVMFLFGLPEHQFVPTSIFTSFCVVAVYALSAVSGRRLIASIIGSNMRDRDGARGKFFVFLPLVSGQIATYAALALVNPLYAKIAFCSMGLGDGLAEPVGLKYGKNKYRVFDPFWNVWNTKSLQGSGAVFVVSIICCVFALVLGATVPFGEALMLGVVYATIITVAEAVAPRGMDNMLIIAIGAAFLHFTMLWIR